MLFVWTSTEVIVRAVRESTARSRTSIWQLSLLQKQTIERIHWSRQQIRQSDEVIAASASILEGNRPEMSVGGSHQLVTLASAV